MPLFDSTAPAEVKAFAVKKAEARLRYVERHLESRELLLDRVTVADAYLLTVLNWAQAMPGESRPTRACARPFLAASNDRA